MTPELRRRIWTRLAIMAVSLAALAGGSVLAIQRGDTGRRVRRHAMAEAQRLVDHARALTGGDPADQPAVRREVAEHLARVHVAHGPFVLIELYDRSRAKAVEVVADARFRELLRGLTERHHAALLRETLEQETFTAGGETFLQVFAPLRGEEGTVAYFEGVYRVDGEVIAALNRGILLTVALVVLVVLAAVAVLYPVILRLNADLLRLSGDLSHANMGLLVALGSAVAKRDRGTSDHNYRVTIYAARLAEEVGLPPDRIRGLIKGAILHDVGKIAVVDAILQKPGRLTGDEVAAMRTHVGHGVEIVSRFRWLDDALEVVQCHHERFDGTGYPARLRGEEIPVAARVFAVVDVFDALTTRRPYKQAAPLGVALSTLVADRGTAFDPGVLDRFVALAPELHRTVSGASEAELAGVLDRILARYFSHEERRSRPSSARGAAPARSEDPQALTLSGTFWIDGRSPERARRPTPLPPRHRAPERATCGPCDDERPLAVARSRCP